MTYDEIMQYPPGTIIELGTTFKRANGAWYNNTDKLIIEKSKQWDSLEFHPNNTYEGIYVQELQFVVEGWLYDGEDWTIVEQTWDGWTDVDFESILNKKRKYDNFLKNIINF